MGRFIPLVSSHGLVLFYLMGSRDATMKEAADLLGLTERRVAQIIRDLADTEYLQIERQGRRNKYRVNLQATFRHPSMSHVQLCEFERLLIPDGEMGASLWPEIEGDD